MRTFFLLLSRNKTLSVATALIALLAAYYVWHRLGYAASPREALFMVRLQIASNDKVADIQLADAMPGNWELVCYNSPYGLNLTLSQYNRTYVSRAFPNEDGWDLFFIASDGTHQAASGNCRSTGLVINPGNKSCVSRASARLRKSGDITSKCNAYTLVEAT